MLLAICSEAYPATEHHLSCNFTTRAVGDGNFLFYLGGGPTIPTYVLGIFIGPPALG